MLHKSSAALANAITLLSSSSPFVLRYSNCISGVKSDAFFAAAAPYGGKVHFSSSSSSTSSPPRLYVTRVRWKIISYHRALVLWPVKLVSYGLNGCGDKVEIKSTVFTEMLM